MACSSGQACPLFPFQGAYYPYRSQMSAVCIVGLPQGGVIEKGVCDLRGGPALPAAVPGRLAAQLWIILAAGRPTGARRRRARWALIFRSSRTRHQRPDDPRSLRRPAHRPARHHPADPLLWLFAKNLVAAQRTAGNVVCRGAALAAAGPLFCRPSDYLLPASGQRCPLGTAHLWRPRRRPRERPALPRKRADPPPAADRRRL